MGQKLQDGKNVLQMSQNGPHSKSHPRQTAGHSNLSFWILDNHYELMLWYDFLSSWNARKRVQEILKFQEIYILKNVRKTA